MLNKISPAPHEAERGLRIRKHYSDGSEILTSSPFKIKLKNKKQAKLHKADQQRKTKETHGKNCLTESQKTEVTTAVKDDCNSVLKWIQR
jgi:hypothetical protein